MTADIKVPLKALIVWVTDFILNAPSHEPRKIIIYKENQVWRMTPALSLSLAPSIIFRFALDCLGERKHNKRKESKKIYDSLLRDCKIKLFTLSTHVKHMSGNKRRNHEPGKLQSSKIIFLLIFHLIGSNFFSFSAWSIFPSHWQSSSSLSNIFVAFFTVATKETKRKTSRWNSVFS